MPRSVLEESRIHPAVRDIVAGSHADIVSEVQAAIAAHPVVAAVIPGGRNAGEVTENAAMMAAKIAGELWAAMRAEKLIPEHAPTPGHM